MNISTNSRVPRSAGYPYQQFNPKVKLNMPVKMQQQVKRNMADHAQNNFNPVEPKDILSKKEMITLQALFSSSMNTKAFYGHTQVKNIQSGFLLDVKG